MAANVHKHVLFFFRSSLKKSHFTTGCCERGSSSSELIVDPLILHLSELRQYCCRPPPSTPFFHFLCFLLLNFLPPPPAILILTLPPPPASSPPKVLLEIYPISFSSSGQNRKGTGSNKTEQQGWDGSSKVIKPRTQTHGSQQGHWGETPGGVGGHFCLCVICWGRHFMCSRWEGWTTRPPTFFSAPTNSAWYLLRLISRNVSF